MCDTSLDIDPATVWNQFYREYKNNGFCFLVIFVSLIAYFIYLFLFVVYCLFVCLFVYFLFACFLVRSLKHYKPAHSFLWSEFIW